MVQNMKDVGKLMNIKDMGNILAKENLMKVCQLDDLSTNIYLSIIDFLIHIPYLFLYSCPIQTGEWLMNCREGKGKEIWPNGAFYIGFWKSNRKHGKGVFKWPDGDFYMGEWTDGKRCLV